MNEKKLKALEVFQSLPGIYPHPLNDRINKERIRQNKILVVLDDDPTGTQTVHGVHVLTSWSVDVLSMQFRSGERIFYILTNSRSLTRTEACKLSEEIGHNLTRAAKEANADFIVLSRSDSTLRGHFPQEVDALAGVLGYPQAVTFLVPAFFEGGRYTLNDVHYLQEGDALVPVSETPFARDKTFGYRHSNLKAYVEEKSEGRIRAADVASISINMLRNSSPESIAEQIISLPGGSVCVVNAADYRDLEVFVLGFLLSGKKAMFRVAASIVPVMAGIEKQPLLTHGFFSDAGKDGCLVIAGSYVPKTSTQLKTLKELSGIHWIEIDIENALNGGATLARRIAKEADAQISDGMDVVIYTARTLVSDPDPEKSLLIGKKVSECITALVQHLKIRPKCILAKGGITSSDVATKGLGVKKALVSGQVAPGVPVWMLGVESKFPGLNYVVFPGNVGDDITLLDVFQKIRLNRLFQ